MVYKIVEIKYTVLHVMQSCTKKAIVMYLLIYLLLVYLCLYFNFIFSTPFISIFVNSLKITLFCHFANVLCIFLYIFCVVNTVIFSALNFSFVKLSSI